MNQVKIEVDPSLSEREAKMNPKTWEAIKEKKGNSVFFPSGTQIPMVSDSFELQFILHIVNENIEDDTMYVSTDVKQNRYPNKDSITY